MSIYADAVRYLRDTIEDKFAMTTLEARKESLNRHSKSEKTESGKPLALPFFLCEQLKNREFSIAYQNGLLNMLTTKTFSLILYHNNIFL